MKNKLKKITVFFLFLCTLKANAAFIDNGTYTTDKLTGLDWLDVTETAGLSVNQVLASPLYNGWHYATDSQFKQLIYNSTGVNITPMNSAFMPASQTDYLIQLLGSTLDKYIQNTYGFLTDDEYLRSIGDTSILHLTYTDGLLGINTTSHLTNRAIIKTYIEQSYEENYVRLNTPLYSFDYSVGYMGSYLVRDTQDLTAVPLPPAIVLFVSGLIGLVASKRNS